MTGCPAAPPDNRLSFADQVMFLSLRATGQEPVAQAVWLYERALDFDGLSRFHRNFGHGLMGRRIERSPLPFGRHRWVASEEPPSNIDIAECARPRAELSDWADERAQLPIDPEWGPGWHIGVLPLTDGSNAVSLVISHCLADGFGGFATVIDAVKGNVRDFGYPPPNSRTRLRAAASDLRETARGVPEVARTLVAAAKLVYARRRDFGQSRESRTTLISAAGADRNFVVPAITVYVDLEDWDDRAKTLAGTSNSLLAGFAAKFAERMGRCADDRAVTLYFPMSDRIPDDTRANAAILAHASVDPMQVTTDLSDVRVAIRQGLKMAREVPDPALQILPLTPFIPKRVVRRAADALLTADLPVACSFLGDLDPAVGRVDGTDADYVMLRGVDRHVTRQLLEKRRGLLTLVAGRITGKMSISIVAYQPGVENSKPLLRELVAHTLGQFDLTGVID
ncbi:hypothetical protein [Mycobacterium haemophilum]